MADGLGGHEAGELASSIAVVEIANHIRNQIGQGKEANVVIEEAKLYKQPPPMRLWPSCLGRR